MTDFASDARLKLTDIEIGRLRAILDSGDRSSFYMAYFAVSENKGALGTAQSPSGKF